MIARGTTARGDRWTEIVLDDGSSVFAFCDADGKPFEDDGGPIHVMGSDQVYDVLEVVVKQRNELRDALAEMIELFDAVAAPKPEGLGPGALGRKTIARIAELRKLVGE